MSAVKKLSHLCLGTSKLDEMISFYCSTLDCKVIHEFRNDKNERYGAFLSAGDGTFFELFNDQNNIPGTRFRHLCFEVSDQLLLNERFLKLGTSLAWSRGKTDKVLQTWIEDPEGNKVEFHLYDEQAVQYPYIMSRSNK